MDNYKLSKDISEFGWTVILIESTEYLPSFAYTVGLWKNYNHPELICFGLSTNTLHAILNMGRELAKKGHLIHPDINYDNFFDKGTTQFIHVDPRNIKDYFGYAIEFYETVDLSAMQQVWADRHNKYPWDVDFEQEFIYKQPLLDRNAEFKFREVKNLAVFTTRQWLEDSKPILRVVHDEDGDWQFLTGDQMPEDIRVVALGQIIKRDKDLNNLFNLDYGEAAERKSKDDKWVRSNIQSN